MDGTEEEALAGPTKWARIALILGLAPDADVPDMQLLFFAARRFIERTGLQQPTVFVFEDIHWAQPSEIALREYLTQHLRARFLIRIERCDQIGLVRERDLRILLESIHKLGI